MKRLSGYSLDGYVLSGIGLVSVIDCQVNSCGLELV